MYVCMYVCECMSLGIRHELLENEIIILKCDPWETGNKVITRAQHVHNTVAPFDTTRQAFLFIAASILFGFFIFNFL